MKKNGGIKKSWFCRENLLLALGFFILFSEAINVEFRGRQFHIELFLGGMTLCGVGLTQKLDKGQGS